MNVLLDTCALLALARGELSDAAAATLRAAPEAWVSIVSPWEVAIKAAARKLRLKEPPVLWFEGLAERYSLREIHLDARIACAAAALPFIHRDPFDRLIAAHSRLRRVPLCSVDSVILANHKLLLPELR